MKRGMRSSIRAVLIGGLLNAILLAGCSNGPEQPGAFTQEPPAQPPWTPPFAYIDVAVSFASRLGDPAPADAGTATVQSTDSANAPVRSFTIEYVFMTGYMGSTLVAPGTYTLTYHPPAGYYVSTGRSQQIVKVQAGDYFASDIEVTP